MTKDHIAQNGHPSGHPPLRPHLRRRFRPRFPRHDRLKTALVVLWAAALALLVLTIIVVFYPPGAPGAVPSPIATSSVNIPSAASGTTSGATSTNGFASTTPPGIGAGGAGVTSTVVATAPGQFASEYSAPYPVNWQEGGAQFSLTGASLQGSELALTLAIQIGAAPTCVPADLRLVADEAGTLRAPDAPAGGAFTFPDTQSCNGTPGAVYSASVSFNVGGIAAPFLLTTGGSANQYFFAATTTAGGVDITLPGTQG